MRVGWRKAYWTIVGNLVALFVIALSAAIGVGALLMQSHTLFSLLKILGGLYLIYLGFKLWQGRKNEVSVDGQVKEQRSRKLLFIDGFTVSMSNPKAVIFLASVFPQFINTQLPLIPQFTMMFGIIVCIVSLIHTAYSIFADQISKSVRSSNINSWLKSVSATVFCGFGLILSFDGINSIRR